MRVRVSWGWEVRCKHTRTRVVWFKSIHEDEASHYMLCARCGTHLPLGPANDDGPHAAQVAIEVRAAELAAAWRPGDGCARLINPSESLGWNGWPYRQPTNADEWTGFLAAQIQNHGPDLGDVNWAGHHMADHPIDSRAAWCIATHGEE